MLFHNRSIRNLITDNVPLVTFYSAAFSQSVPLSLIASLCDTLFGQRCYFGNRRNSLQSGKFLYLYFVPLSWCVCLWHAVWGQCSPEQAAASLKPLTVAPQWGSGNTTEDSDTPN